MESNEDPKLDSLLLDEVQGSEEEIHTKSFFLPPSRMKELFEK